VRDDHWNLNNRRRIKETAHVDLNNEVIANVDLRRSGLCESWGDGWRSHEVNVEINPAIRLNLNALVVVELNRLEVFVLVVVVIMMEMNRRRRIWNDFGGIVSAADQFDLNAMDLLLGIVLNAESQPIGIPEIENWVLEANMKVNMLRTEESLVELVDIVETNLRQRKRRVEHSGANADRFVDLIG